MYINIISQQMKSVDYYYLNCGIPTGVPRILLSNPTIAQTVNITVSAIMPLIIALFPSDLFPASPAEVKYLNRPYMK